MSHTALPRFDPAQRPNLVVRAYVSFMNTSPGRWTVINISPKLDPWLLRRTGGRLSTGTILPTALLTTIGARSGEPRTVPVLYFHDGDDVILIPSNYGREKHPAWYYNLRANPDVRIGKTGEGMPMTATIVTDEAERDRLWSLADRMCPIYADYRRRADAINRVIPIVRLTPRD